MRIRRQAQTWAFYFTGMMHKSEDSGHKALCKARVWHVVRARRRDAARTGSHTAGIDGRFDPAARTGSCCAVAGGAHLTRCPHEGSARRRGAAKLRACGGAIEGLVEKVAVRWVAVVH